MKRLTIFKHFLLSLFLAVCFAGSAYAGSGWVLISTVEFDDQDGEVGGISETYLTYDIAYYYDAVADGLLYYTNPLEVIDGDYGEGIDDTYFDIDFGIMYGIEVDYYTNDYRRNRIVCADTEHWARLVVIPLIAKSFYDPFQLSKRTPGSYEAYHKEEIPSEMADAYSSNEYEYLGYTYACLRTPTVGAVTFEPTYSNQLTANPSGDYGLGVVFGGGKRIFPDRQSPTDTADRKTVQVRAQLLPSGGDPAYTSGVKVFFKNFDVDDPSGDSTIDDNGNLGDDNREGRETPQSAGSFSNCAGVINGLCYALTNTSGVATVNFSVTKQPGDNFVVSASTDQSYLTGVSVNGTGLKDSGNNQLPTTQAKRTELLTVWRKLYMEVDSMTTVGNNVVNGRIRTKTTVGSTPVWVNISPNTGDLETGRFAGGQMTSGTYRFEVLNNEPNRVLIQSNNGSATLFTNALFQLFDDDDFNNNDRLPPGDGTLDGDDGEDVQCLGTQPKCLDGTFSRVQPTSDINTNIYAAAYLEPEYEWAEQQGYNQQNVPFFLNIENIDQVASNERTYIDPYRNTRNTPGNTFERDDFWIGYVQVGYQWDEFLFDGDPGPPFGGGIAPADSINDVVDDADDSLDVFKGAIGCLVFIETVRDADETVPGSTYDLKNRIVPHELGHQLGLRGHQPVFGIMDVNTTTDIYRLVPRHISVIRWRVASPGEPNF